VAVDIRLLRSWLSVPGDSERKLARGGRARGWRRCAPPILALADAHRGES
jgi:hypothetical protein